VRALLPAALAALALATPAPAATCQAPPGTAAIEQYCETVPTASGDDAKNAGGSPDGIARATLDRIEAAAGPAAVDTIGGTQVAGSPSGRGEARRPTATGEPAKPAPERGNPLDAIASAAGSGAQVGGPLVYSLLGLTLLLAGGAWLRFRRSPH
jgi:hypothetical protein